MRGYVLRNDFAEKDALWTEIENVRFDSASLSRLHASVSRSDCSVVPAQINFLANREAELNFECRQLQNFQTGQKCARPAGKIFRPKDLSMTAMVSSNLLQ